ncbi:MAG TPA: prepilin peptidase [Allosphingosinicella sp.]|nr:prepilin peptidase [Allosphingosinicella sp.]
MSEGVFLQPPLWLAATFGAVLGLLVGSFLATMLIRWPAGRSVIGGRSRCDGCGKALGPLELVPVISWLVRRGRCRHCGAAIDSRQVAIELAAGLIGLVAALAHPLPLALATAGFGWWLLLIAALDLEHQWLPDLLTLPLLALGLAAAWAGFGPPLAERAIGAAIGWASLALIAFLYRRIRGREGMGGGDPKMFGAAGAWVGAWNLPAILLAAGLLGLAAVLAMRLRGETVSATSRLPLGTLIALAAWPAWLLVAQSVA